MNTRALSPTSLFRFMTLAVIAGLVAAAPAAGAGPGLPRTYDVSVINPPAPLPGGGGNFGWGVTSADLTGDGKMDLLVAQSQDNVPGKISIFDGATNRHIETFGPPEQNPDSATRAEALAFVYVEHMADIGSCPGGDGGDADKICDDQRVGGRDGIPEIIAGSRSMRVDPASPLDSEIDTLDPSIGRGYVFDGKTRVVLKRIDMPPAERQAQYNRLISGTPTPANTSVATNFARVMTSPKGLPPCAGRASEGNNAGVAACTTDDMPEAVRIGDVDAAGFADIVVTARSYRETSTKNLPNTAPAGSQCATTAPAANSTTGTCVSGKAWIYRGEEIANSSPREILDGVTNGNATGVSTSESLPKTVYNPSGQSSSGQEYGGNVWRLGDVGGCTPPAPPAADANPSPRCTSVTRAPDGKPDFVVVDDNVDYPLASGNVLADVGAAHVYDGPSGALRDTYQHPEPGNNEGYTDGFNSGFATGNLGHSTLPDFMAGAPTHNVTSVGDGRSYVYNGDAASTRGLLIGVLDDPTPAPAGNFGSSQTGVGDLVSGSEYPANEVMVGSYSPFITSTEAAAELISDVHILNPTRDRVLQTIPDPAQEKGSGFGVGMTPMGDLNGDGYLDFAISSYLSNAPGQPADGRAFIFRSNNSPPGPPTPGAITRLLRPGNCANDRNGTNRSDRLRGTAAGDRMFGFRGNDLIESLASGDCIDGGSGRDRLGGGSGNDRVIGRSGNDRLSGSRGRDRLFGVGGRDRLVGGSGRDLLAGGRSNDRLSGGSGNDRLFGESGNDRLNGGSGRNRMDAGSGRDSVNARNRRKDRINCGSGRDRALVDRSDIVRNCERVRRR